MSGIPNLPGQSKLPGGLKAKQRHQPKYRLPVLNWSALRPNQVAGTIFNELDDDSVLNEVLTLERIVNLCRSTLVICNLGSVKPFGGGGFDGIDLEVGQIVKNVSLCILPQHRFPIIVFEEIERCPHGMPG